MKKICVTALVMLLCLNTITSAAANKKALKARIENMTTEQKEARSAEINQRVNEIKKMDKSSLSTEEKQGLKSELKDMRQEAKAIGRGGVYISFAGIIIIILLLILIL